MNPKALFFTFLMAASLTAFSQKSPTASAPSCDIFVPNAFTPNDDGINERFSVKAGESCSMISFNMKVFDRWGRVVFETDNPSTDAAWDGTLEGRKLQAGVYMYQLVAEMSNANTRERNFINYKGSLVLIR